MRAGDSCSSGVGAIGDLGHGTAGASRTPGHCVVVAFVGDVMFGARAREIMDAEGAASLARRVWGPVQDANLVVINLEGPTTNADTVRSQKLINLSSPPETLALLDDRFVVSLANNHIMDYREKGLVDTLEALQRRGIPHAGAGRNLAEARRPAICEANGARIGVLCAADPRYEAAGQHTAGTMPTKPELLREALTELRSTVDLVVVSLHMGLENTSVPSPLMLSLADLCLDEGASVVVFHHAHCVSGITRDDRGACLWGTGNYVFEPPEIMRRFSPWYESAVWLVELDVSGKKIGDVLVKPVTLDDEGFPSAADGSQADRIVSQVFRWSTRIAKNRYLGIWRLLSWMAPRYLRLVLRGYARIARREGVRGVVEAISSTVNTQLRTRGVPEPRRLRSE